MSLDNYQCKEVSWAFTGDFPAVFSLSANHLTPFRQHGHRQRGCQLLLDSTWLGATEFNSYDVVLSWDTSITTSLLPQTSQAFIMAMCNCDASCHRICTYLGT